MPENRGMTDKEAKEAMIKGEKVRTTAGGREYEGTFERNKEEDKEIGVLFLFVGNAVGRESERIELMGNCRDFWPVKR